MGVYQLPALAARPAPGPPTLAEQVAALEKRLEDAEWHLRTLVSSLSLSRNREAIERGEGLSDLWQLVDGIAAKIEGADIPS